MTTIDNTTNKDVKLNLDDYKEAFQLSKNIDNFEILYKSLFFYYWKLQKILIEHSTEIKQEFENKLFQIVSYEEFIKKYKTNNDEFLLDAYKIYYWDKKEKNEIKIALFLSNFLRFILGNDKSKNLKNMFALLTWINKNNPWDKIIFGAEQSKIIYPVISKEVYWWNRWFYIIEPDNIINWFKEGRFLIKYPSQKLRIIKQKISGAENTNKEVLFYWQFHTVINNLSKIDFMKINGVEQEMYKPYLAVWFYNQLQYCIKKWWLNKEQFFSKDIMLEYNIEDFFDLFDRYFLSYIVVNNPKAKWLKDLALLIK